MDFTHGNFMKATKATKDALTGLEWAILQTIERPREPDEFTIADMMRESRGGTRYTIQRRLTALVESGACTRRRFGKDFLYRKASGPGLHSDHDA
jgi:predicted transcriptional regulator